VFPVTSRFARKKTTSATAPDTTATAKAYLTANPFRLCQLDATTKESPAFIEVVQELSMWARYALFRMALARASRRPRFC
jgi:hypothetical protein